ncbi:hypothetical protein ABH944_003021 [Caballeronia udeis]|uniref:Lipoprotein n=1 Tax=Caballeronia udeis TaxID=1232866 RepID=A0ABW8MGV2_9BURK
MRTSIRPHSRSLAAVGFVLISGAYANMARADVDCNLLAPPGAAVSEKGKVEAKTAADAILKAVKFGGDVTVSGEKSLSMAQQNAPTDDPQALKARTLYLFCGMVANAKDINTGKKFDMLMQLQGVKLSPEPNGGNQPPPPESDVPSALGLPKLGSSRESVESFAKSRNGSWHNAQGGDYAVIDGDLADTPAKINLWVDSNGHLYKVEWTISSSRYTTARNDHVFGRSGEGPVEPDALCDAAADRTANYFVRAVGLTSSPVTTKSRNAADPWNYIQGGKAPACGDSDLRCTATADITDQLAILTRDKQSAMVQTRSIHARSSSELGISIYVKTTSTCSISAEVTRRL